MRVAFILRSADLDWFRRFSGIQEEYVPGVLRN